VFQYKNNLFSDAIHIKFAIEKCATASLARGKLAICDDLEVSKILLYLT